MPTQPHYLGRAAERQRAVEVTRQANRAITPLNERLAELTPAYNGLVYLATPRLDARRPRRGQAVATYGAEAPHAPAAQNKFYRENIAGRGISLANTAFGTAIAEHLATPKEPIGFRSSRLNPEQLTLTTPVTARDIQADRKILGALQVALDPAFGIIENTEEMKAVIADAQPLLSELGQEFDALDTPTRSLGRAVNAQAPLTPNAFLLRWDTINSTELALSDTYPEVENYFDDMNAMIEAETREFFSTRSLNTGDGQNIVINLPELSRYADIHEQQRSIRLFGRQAITPLVARIVSTQAEIADQYKALSPKMRLSVGLGYVEDETGQVFWDVANVDEADKNETNPSQGQVRYTSAAQAALNQR